MYVQFSKALPGVMVDESRERILFDTSCDPQLLPLERFYEHYLAEDLEWFGLSSETAEGILYCIGYAARHSRRMGERTGDRPDQPGADSHDEQLRASLYNELLADTIVKNAAMNARWQVRQLRKVRPNVVIFVDEPYMASFGSAYISLGREQVIAMLDGGVRGYPPGRWSGRCTLLCEHRLVGLAGNQCRHPQSGRIWLPGELRAVPPGVERISGAGWCGRLGHRAE